jgi:hypothetical protein
MIIQYAIADTSWTPITTAGQSGSCWLDEQNDGLAGKSDARIFHSSTPPEATDVTKAKRVYKPIGNNDIMIITADSSSDIYYARMANAGDTAVISVDVI